MKSILTQIIILLICIISRLLTSVYYIEDVETLNFLLGFNNYDLASSTPPLPGYPVFYSTVWLINILIQNIPSAFAVLGGICTYVIIYYSSRILRVSIFSLEGGLTGFLIFFNANIWLMGNKFLPEIFALAVMLPVFYYHLIDNFKTRYVYKGAFLAGLLPGILFSWLPLVILPLIYVFIRRKKFIFSIPIFISGICIWLLPFIFYVGPQNLYNLTGIYLNSLFTGVSETGNRPGFMILSEAVWAEVLAGYIPGRNLFTIFTSIGSIAFVFFGMMITLSFGHQKTKLLIGISSFLLFFLTTIIFRDSYNVHRYILPLTPFLMIFICYGIIYFLVNFNIMSVKILCALFIITYVSINVSLAFEHKESTAIAKVQNHLGEVENKNIISFPEINYYLQQTGVSGYFLSIEKIVKKEIPKNSVLILPPAHPAPAGYSKVVELEHNPLINRQWPELNIYFYK